MGSGGHELGGTVVTDALAGLFTEKGETASGSAAEAALAVARGFNEVSRQGCDGAGFFIYVSIAAQVTGIVEDDGLGCVICIWSLMRDFVLVAGQKLAVVLNFRGRAVLFPVLLDGADAVRADGDDFLDFILGKVFEIGFG